MDLGMLVFIVIKILVVFGLVMLTVAYLTLLERKVLAHMQVRVGPMFAGPHGILQPIADGIKLFFKEDIVTKQADKVFYFLAPALSIIPVLMIFAVIPFGDKTTLFGLLKEPVELRITGLRIDILYVFAMSGLATYGVVFGGWSQNNKYALIGGIREAAQLISYEVAFTLSIFGVVMVAGTLQLDKIVEAQRNVWFIVYQPVGFLIFLTASVAELKRTPFDLPEAESELVAGFHADYSSMKFAMFFMAEYASIVVCSCLGTLLFLGGWLGPSILPPFVWYLIKVFVLIFVIIWLRATYPRLRYDQLMKFGWKFLIPVSFLNIFVTAIVILLVR
ncbi:MAG: NADH-quinone oxidoreductase subunit NuoH [Deltaproteobacteria bacterium]|nr:NADH-quinone oxidoreductase subunit NuoH [Deltaproteobacteria bacterium]MBW2067879.1 NADH-quinone oxidoreductase subunit NuoH [Deltaproteobacteria bacterium]